MFSSQQANLRKEVEGFKYTPGKVLVNGRYKQYTEIVSDPDNATYPDAIVVASGEKSRMIYRKQLMIMNSVDLSMNDLYVISILVAVILILSFAFLYMVYGAIKLLLHFVYYILIDENNKKDK